jgi:hypothetical protein
VKGFKEIDWPPEIPEDPHFRFEVTTVLVPSERPYEIGNHLLEFLSTQVVSSNTKVRTPSDTSQQKCSIIADVFSQNLMCNLRVQLYQNPAADQVPGEGATFAVEFQRRSGDSLAFNHTFQQAVEFLKARMGLGNLFLPAAAAGSPHPPTRSPSYRIVRLSDVEEPEEQMPRKNDGIFDFDALDGPDEDDDIVEQDVDLGLLPALGLEEVAPLLDMASLNGSPALQAEAATALAELAGDDQAAEVLCTERAFTAFKQLLGVVNDGEAAWATAVGYPTALMLERLAQHSAAMSFFAEQGILELILKKVQSKELDALVQREFARALAFAVPRCAKALDGPAREALRAGLLSATSGKDPTLPREQLQEALIAIRT